MALSACLSVFAAGRGTAAAVVPAPTGNHPRGTVVVIVRVVDQATRDNGCAGVGGFGDIVRGSDVHLTDGNGTALGTAALGVAQTTANGAVADIPPNACEWTMRMRGVPRDGAEYVLHIGDSGRAALTLSRAKLAAAHWVFGAQVGR